MTRVAVFALLAAAAGVAAGAGSRQVSTATAVCATHSFTMTFDPKRQAIVSDDAGHVLASASFTSRAIAGSCRRVAGPKRYVGAGLGSPIRGRTSFRCLANQPIRVHVNPIRNDAGAVVGSSLQVGIGTDARLRVIASAILKNKGNPYASRVYRAATYCKLGA